MVDQKVSSSNNPPLFTTLGLSSSRSSVTLPPAVRSRSSTMRLLASRAARGRTGSVNRRTYGRFSLEANTNQASSTICFAGYETASSWADSSPRGSLHSHHHLHRCHYPIYPSLYPFRVHQLLASVEWHSETRFSYSCFSQRALER